jgi:hypothetical protein
MASLLGVADAHGGMVKVATTEKSILGAWEATDRAWHIEFAPDGVIRMKTRGPAKTGTYQLDAEGILWVRMATGRDYRAPLKMVHQDQLLIMKSDGSSITFRRVE